MFHYGYRMRYKGFRKYYSVNIPTSIGYSNADQPVGNLEGGIDVLNAGLPALFGMSCLCKCDRH
jgi:hypothetical protein